MNKTAIDTFYDSIKGMLTEEQRSLVSEYYVDAKKLDKQNYVDFGYRVREVEDIKDVYSGRVFVFKTYPERLYEDYFVQTFKP